MVCMLPARLEDVFVQFREEWFVGCGAVHEGMARRVDQASFIRVEHFERRRQIFRKNRQEV